MNCDKFNECLDNYENLSDETKHKMDKHALECANCKSELEFMRSIISCLLYTSPSPRDAHESRMPSSA